ncbi:thrombospondin type-1 domain-containing protein 4 [Drosophila rhopaloa]|uniref:PLAC domain-containing protein n=1 Tax=Drosophila rhopaloa TaxID=1041015 RepID=A0ABM5JBC3_DRORH|nr:thrombospondin type-1 domain-containing protein 4 [Drosophila rhopaloa]XP_044316124.1 thrombospondin type-1 domain-containing protein 4 [Drosophila rhopaloa]XP_044316125.1 thrombospondin type-1 domain-containing protein 4 [Drosophila rhopaloa]
MAKLLLIFSIFIALASILDNSFVKAELSTKDRIKKHQDWLKEHSKPKAKKIHTNNSYYELANLWHTRKNLSLKQKPTNKEEYLENETTSKISNKSNEIVLKPTNIFINDTKQNTSTPKSDLEATTIATLLTKDPIENGNVATTSQTPSIVEVFSSPNPPKVITTKKLKKNVNPYPRWDKWSNWSACSRSCGGGVKYQIRKCISKNPVTNNQLTSNACVGYFKRYQLCNDVPCDAQSPDFRATQCTTYNEIEFHGHRYRWEPYVKDDAECELNCMPFGMKSFATLNESVIDGTPCQHPAEYYRSQLWDRAVCVDGACKAVHASGDIDGLYAHSGSVTCGGLLCRPVTGIFTRDPLPEHELIHVTTLPAGASNISITELKNSINLLVLRTSNEVSVFNGESTVSESGSYEAVGATFDYHRIDGAQDSTGVTEWITSIGPIRDSLQLMVFTNSPNNTGIKYEYMLPVISESEENEMSLESNDGLLRSGIEDTSSSSSSRAGRKRIFNWKVIGFSSCTKSCGGGTQTPIIRCIRKNPLRYYSQRRCMHSVKPVLNENLLHCNTQPCPAYWRLDEWGECRCLSSGAFRRREVSCVQELASGLVIHVDKAACMEDQPPTQKQCECPRNRRRNLSRYRLPGTLDYSNSTQVKRSKIDGSEVNAIWLTSEWNQYCSAACGSGVEYRTVFCDRSKAGEQRCDPSITPESRRPCEKSSCKVGDWFTGPWSSCNGDCFDLTRSREVLCILNQLITEATECKAELKPQSEEKCSHEEVEYCAARWHYSEWSECSKSCGGGNQRRSVKCLEYDMKLNVLRESSQCRYTTREPIYRGCNAQNCEEVPITPAVPICTDKFPNCQLASQAKLCSYDYYRDNCCASCTGGI